MAAHTSQAIPTTTMAAQTSQAIPTSGVLNLGSGRRQPYGMPTTLMQGLPKNPSTSSESLNVNMPQLFNPRVSVPFGTPQQSLTPFGSPQQSLTNASLNALRQQMEETNHEMVNLVTQQVGAVINPLIRDTNKSYQAMSVQMERMADLFGAPAARNTPVSRNLNAGSVENPAVSQINQVPENQGQPQRIQQPAQEEPEAVPIVVNRHQDADQVVMQARRNNYKGQNNIANVVEALLAQNGFNMGLHRPNFVSALSEYVLETDLPRNTKIPKFIKFARETNESTGEHIARYLMEAGDLENNENLKMKYFPSSLMKNAFTWFTTLPPHSIFTWNQLEKAFHEQFYMGQSKISLKELASV